MEHKELVWETIEAFRSIGVQPHLVPQGTMRHLRECLWCLDLEKLENIDSVTISAQGNPRTFDSKLLFRFEYALRGTIKDIPPNRNIAYTDLSWKGFIKKKLNSLKWVIPKETDTPSSFHKYGSPPKHGEVWEEGPHKILVGLLNEDSVLTKSIKEFGQRFDEVTIFNIHSDKWGESIRLSCSIWIDEKKVNLYVSPLYIKISQSVLDHVRVVRRQFGGLTF